MTVQTQEGPRYFTNGYGSPEHLNFDFSGHDTLDEALVTARSIRKEHPDYRVKVTDLNGNVYLEEDKWSCPSCGVRFPSHRLNCVAY